MKFLGHQPKTQKGFSSTHVELFDGEAFTVTHTATTQAAEAIEKGRAQDIRQLIIANGAFTGRAALRPLVEGLIGIAGASGKKLEVTTYDDPRTGSRAYGQSYRTERFAHVVDHVRERHSLDTDHPVNLAGQSRGWLTLVQAAAATYKDQRIDSLTGMAPVGHTPRNLQVNTHDVMYVVGLTAGELTDKRAGQGKHARATKRGLAANAIAHTIGNGFSPFTVNPMEMVRRSSLPLFQEVHEILTTDITPEVVELSKNVGSVTILACQHDRYAPGERIAQRFANEPGFAGQVVMLDTPHNGLLMDSRLVPEVYGHVMGEPAPQLEVVPEVDIQTGWHPFPAT
jgi:hypothetical protein